MDADTETLAARIEAVERALTDGDSDVSDVTDAAARERRLDDLESALADVDDRLADLEATVQSLRGYLGGVQSVNEDVERRANAALSKVESLEAEREDVGLRRERLRLAESSERPTATAGDERLTPTEAAERAMTGAETDGGVGRDQGTGRRAQATGGGPDTDRAAETGDRPSLVDRIRDAL